MDLSALALGLMAAGLWGLAGFAGGLAARQVGALLVAAGAQLVGLVAIVVVLVVLRPEMPRAEDLVLPLVGGLAGGLGLAALFRALSVGQMGLVAPIAGTGVAVPIVAGFVMGEQPAAHQTAGVLLAVGGVLTTTYERRSLRAPGGRASAGVGFAVLAAGLFGLFYLGLDAGGDDDPLWTVAAARVLSVVVLVALVGAMARRRPAAPAVNRKIVASGALDVAGNLTFTVATTRGLLVLAAVPAALYPVVTLLCARAVLAERLQATQRLGTLLALAGLALMAIPA